MKSADEFIKDLKPLPKQNKIKSLTKEDILIEIDIIEYLLNHKEEVNYSKRTLKKLENKLKELKENIYHE